MRIGTVDINKLRGIGDKFVGLGRELIGTLTDNRPLIEAGEAQQERATEQLRALRAEIKAEKADAKAAAFEQEQKVAQAAKS